MSAVVNDDCYSTLDSLHGLWDATWRNMFSNGTWVSGTVFVNQSIHSLTLHIPTHALHVNVVHLRMVQNYSIVLNVRLSSIVAANIKREIGRVTKHFAKHMLH